MLKKEKEKSETRIGFDETLWYFVWKQLSTYFLIIIAPSRSSNYVSLIGLNLILSQVYFGY